MSFDAQKTREFIKWLIGVFRPKFYNIITRSVVGVGLILSLQSQTDFIDYIAFLVFREFGYDPSLLQELLFGSEISTLYGVVLVFMGLTYHLLVVSFDKNHRLISYEHVPEFRVSLLDQENNEWGKEICCRGSLCDVDFSGVPEYSRRYDSPLVSQFISPFVNPSYYKECLQVLSKWGGSELISLKIENISSVLARNVRLEIVINDDKYDIYIDNTFKSCPNLPATEGNRIPHIDPRPPKYDILKNSRLGDKYFEWHVGNVQASQKVVSKTRIHIRPQNRFRLHIKVFCDEFSEPLVFGYEVFPAKDVRRFTSRDVYRFERDFLSVLDNVFMDGYVSRYLNRKLEEGPSPRDF